MEMEMRGEEDIEKGKYLTPPLSPLSFSLYDSFLFSHCSSCFSPLLPTFPLNSPHIPTPSLLYCSPTCSHADSSLHLSTAELHLFQSQSPTCPDTADLRVALRLLRSLLATWQWHPSRDGRIAGLLTNRQKLMSREENSDLPARIRDGAKAMAAARRLGDNGRDFSGVLNEAVLEEAVLCLVLTNAVEVQDNKGRNLGIAVYDTAFSWINHSCSPNACYRFFISSPNTPSFPSHSSLRIVPSTVGEDGACGNSVLTQGGGEGHGPRIIVRSIKRIKKGEEVTVAYTDLLQPKAMRQSELWSKYQFICCCRRCSASPPAYVDHALQEIFASNLDSSSLCSNHNFYRDNGIRKLTDYVDEVISEYLSVGDPDTCCEKFENMLTHGLPDERLDNREEKTQSYFKLHPLNHLSLNAYTTLASAYKIRASDLLAVDSEMDKHQLEAFNLSRTSAAYSLVLAGATDHLFRSESSLIASAANFWTSAGESLLTLARSSMWCLFLERGLPFSNLSFLEKHKCSKCSLIDRFEDNLSCSQPQSADFEKISIEFLDCVTNITQKVWSFLIQSCEYLKLFEDPIDFSWLDKTSSKWDFQSHLSGTNMGSNSGNKESMSRCEARGYTIEGRINIFQLGIHCLLYGGFLGHICYGQNSHLACHIQDILYHEDNLVH